jgi:hypothetical protein
MKEGEVMKLNPFLSLVLAVLISAGSAPAMAYTIDDPENGANRHDNPGLSSFHADLHV